MNLEEIDMYLEVRFRGKYDYASGQIKLLLFLWVSTNMTIESSAINHYPSFLDYETIT